MVSIRRFGEGDRGVVRDLVLQLHEALRPFDVDLAPGDQIIERYFDALLSEVERTAGAVFVAEDDGRAVGYVCVWGLVTPDDPDERPDPYSFMAELFVQPDWRGLGTGRRLVEQAERFAAGCGAYKMELKALAQNESAVHFYESLGYAPRVIIMRKHIGVAERKGGTAS